MARAAGSRVRALTDYPRPSVAVDVAMLTVRDDSLRVVVVEHRLGGWALPGTFLHEGERLSDAASRALREKAGLDNALFTQLEVFDDPTRDERGWVLSVAHTGGLADERIPAEVTVMRVVNGQAEESLRFDHNKMVALAVVELRRRYANSIDPAGLLDRTFTVLQLRRLYQAVFGRPLVKDTFRRYIIDALEPTGEMATAFGRPAELFRRREDSELPPSAWAFLVGSGR
jgi:8-oxo-dGTP diphosphatase